MDCKLISHFMSEDDNVGAVDEANSLASQGGLVGEKRRCDIKGHCEN